MADKPFQAEDSQPNSESNDTSNNEESFSSSQLDQISKMINSAFTGRFKPLQATLTSLHDRLVQDDNQEQPEQDDKMSNKQKIARLESQLKAMADEKATAVAKERDLSLRQNVKDKLIAAGIAPNMIKAAMSVLIDTDKSIGYDDDNQIVFRHTSGDMDLDTGLKTWTATEEAKAFKAARKVMGSGDHGYSTSGASSNKQLSEEELGNAFIEAFKAGRL